MKVEIVRVETKVWCLREMKRTPTHIIISSDFPPAHTKKQKSFFRSQNPPFTAHQPRSTINFWFCSYETEFSRETTTTQKSLEGRGGINKPFFFVVTDRHTNTYTHKYFTTLIRFFLFSKKKWFFFCGVSTRSLRYASNICC